MKLEETRVSMSRRDLLTRIAVAGSIGAALGYIGPRFADNVRRSDNESKRSDEVSALQSEFYIFTGVVSDMLDITVTLPDTHSAIYDNLIAYDNTLTQLLESGTLRCDGDMIQQASGNQDIFRSFASPFSTWKSEDASFTYDNYALLLDRGVLCTMTTGPQIYEKSSKITLAKGREKRTGNQQYSTLSVDFTNDYTRFSSKAMENFADRLLLIPQEPEWTDNQTTVYTQANHLTVATLGKNNILLEMYPL